MMDRSEVCATCSTAKRYRWTSIRAFIGSSTRKYTTASTLTVTLSRVMPSWDGMGMVTICTLTFRSRSMTGTMYASPGSRMCGRARPKRNTMPRSYWLTTRRPVAANTATAPSANTRASIIWRLPEAYR